MIGIPPLTEQWAATYMEVLSGVLIFALGVAALIMQLAVPSYLHTLATRKGLWKRYTRTLVGALAITAAFIWVLHPTPDQPLTGLPALIGHLLMTGTLLAMIVVTVRYVRSVDSTRLVQSLVDECDIDLSNNGRFDDTLDNLIDIGGQAHAGFEKEQVIRAIGRLAAIVLDKYHLKYDGTTLKPLLFGLEEMLVQGSEVGSRQNFRTAARVIKDIIDHLNDLPDDLRDSSDMADLISVTTSMTITVMDLMREDNRLPATYYDILEAAPPGTTALEMYRVGVYALKYSNGSSKSYELSVRALLYLLPVEGELTGTEKNGAELLGMMAHMWYHNDGTRQLIENLLAQLRERFLPNLNAAIEQAINFHFSTTDFDTVDLLKRARTDWSVAVAAD